MPQTIVDVQYRENYAIRCFFEESGEITFNLTVEDNFRKQILLVAASYFEYRVTNIILSYCRTHSRNNQIVLEFIKNKAMSRQYHSYFSWKANNVNQFLGLFGDEFSDSAKKTIQSDKILADAVSAFIKIGRMRNEMVHENFGEYQMSLSSKEVYEMYKKACVFLDFLEKSFSCDVE